jgi:hypothetical protein
MFNKIKTMIRKMFGATSHAPKKVLGKEFIEQTVSKSVEAVEAVEAVSKIKEVATIVNIEVDAIQDDTNDIIQNIKTTMDNIKKDNKTISIAEVARRTGYSTYICSKHIKKLKV